MKYLSFLLLSGVIYPLFAMEPTRGITAMVPQSQLMKLSKDEGILQWVKTIPLNQQEACQAWANDAQYTIKFYPRVANLEVAVYIKGKALIPVLLNFLKTLNK